MTAIPSQPPSPERTARQSWERACINAIRSVRAAEADPELSRAERYQAAWEAVCKVHAASSVLLEANARGPYPPARSHRGGAA